MREKSEKREKSNYIIGIKWYEREIWGEG